MTKQQPVILSPGTPQISAAKFKTAKFPTLICYQNEWMSWNGSAYVGLEAETIEASLSAFMGEAKIEGSEVTRDESGKKVQTSVLLPFHPKPRDIADVAAMLKHSCHVPIGTMDPPAWLAGTPEKYRRLDPRNLISFKNGLLDISTRKLYPATPHFFTRTALPIEYDAKAPEPTLWLEFLQQVTKERQPLIDLIQEMLGYLISTDTSLHRIFFLWGRPRSGKGTILRVTTALVGEPNMRFPSIETLAGRFGLQNLIGASVAQVTDMNTQSRADLGRAASRLNGVSGEDHVTIERKGIGDWNGKLGTRFQLAGNTLPNFGTNTVAIATRLLIMPFDVTFEGREDRQLTAKLIAELAGIMNWALAGLDRLRERGDFLEPSQSVAAKKRLINLSDAVHGFVAEHCIVKAGRAVDKSVLYSTYAAYCEVVNAHPQSLAAFTEGLQANYPSVAASKRRNGSGAQTPCYRGVGLNDETAFRMYETAHDDSDDLGVGPLIVLRRDSTGWPIPRPRGDDFGV